VLENVVETTLRPELADNGGHFYRSDFQVHTPRDTQWDGPRPTSATERRSFAADFVQACRAKQLHAVAITDHHDFVFFPYIAEAARDEVDAEGKPIAEKDRLVVFPGLELTLSVPCQAIMILDTDFPHSKLDDVLKALHFEPIDAALGVIPQTIPLQDSGDINALHDKLDKHLWLKGRYILLPNVSPAGYKSLLRQSFQTKYNDMPCVGGYLDGDMSVFTKKVGEKRILDGGDKAWGLKRLALFQTSDSRAAGFSELGESSSWVKWARPTAEALRQACLARESRVSHDEPPVPNAWISRIVVSGSKFMGHVDVALNRQYTALIGGRGTGKSTTLDYLRWALCDQPANATDDDEVADPRVRQRKLIAATLAPLEAHVEIHCTINGIPHVVRRYAKSGEAHLKVGDNAFEVVRESVIQSLVPVQAYSQKQLSSVAIRLDELLRFITSPIQRQLEDIDRKVAEASAKLRENYGTLQRYRVLTGELKKSEVRSRSLADQAQSLRNGLAGLSEADRLVLDNKAPYDNVKASVDLWKHQTRVAEAAVAEAITAVNGSLSSLEMPQDVPNAVKEQSELLLAQTHLAIQKLQQDLTTAALTFSNRDASGGDSLNGLFDAYDETYKAVKQRSSAHDVKLRELNALEEQQRVVGALLQEQRRELAQIANPDEQQADLRLVLTQLNAERSQALKKQCFALSVSSDGLIKADLSVGQGFTRAQEKFKALIAGSNVRGAKLEAVFDELVTEKSPVETWERVLQELEDLMLLEPDADVHSSQTPILTRLGLPVADQKKIAPRLTPDGWLDLSLTPLTDQPEFRYRSKEDEYIPFNSASAGQQASALLTTLLAQDGMPLIIDQPEDDLDSDTVQKIVSKIWESKGHRQIIFSSHNANLVVNGDADLVLVCAYATIGDQSAGLIKVEGAIDMADVRLEITSVMEGGEKAFRLRKEKYGF